MKSLLYFLCFFVFASSPILAQDDPADPFGIYGAVCLAGKEGLYNPANAFGVPWFNIDLDESPLTRWNTVGQIYGKKMESTVQTVKTMAGIILDGLLWDVLIQLMNTAYPQIPQPYRDELKGMADASGVSIEELTLLNLFYEISKGCTSIVAEDSNGIIYHARNQDFGTFFIWEGPENHQWAQTEGLRDLLINVNFIKGGKVLFKGVTFAGHLGILTGLKPNAFTLSTNARAGSTLNNLINFFINGPMGKQFLIYADREVLESANSYSEAMDYLQNVPLFAYGYFIVGGASSGEGAIITRNPNGTDHVQTLDRTKPGGWYVLQTNYDWDKEVLYLDDRRGPGHTCMNKLTQNKVGLAGLFQVLSSKPNLNKATVYTSVMQVNTPVLE
ncbi:hypothetical protein FO519_009036, partial [Halicephalobus sp. NKZ332]